MAWTRKSGTIPSFTPEEQAQADEITSRVRNSGGSPGESEPPKPAGEPSTPPRPLLPNYYRRGGSVKHGSDTVVSCVHKHR